MAGGFIGWVEDRLKPVKELFSKVGLTKENLNKASGLIAAINPILGGSLAVLTAEDKKKGLIQAVTGIVLGNVINGSKNLLNLSAAGRHTQLTNAIGNMLQNPKDLVVNTLEAGGNIKNGLVATLGGAAGTLLSGSPGSMDAINGSFLGNINLGGFGLDDAFGIYSLIETLKSEPPEVPDPIVYAFIDDEMKENLLATYSQVIDDQTEKNLKYAKETYNSRGLWRSMGPDMLTGAESDINIEAGKAKAAKSSELDMQQLEQNNRMKAMQNQDIMQKYGLEAAAEASRAESAAEIAGDYLAGGGLFGKGGQVAPAPPVTGKENTAQQAIDAIIANLRNNEGGGGAVGAVGGGGVGGGIDGMQPIPDEFL